MSLQAWRRVALPVVLLLSTAACSNGAAQDPKDQLIAALRAMRTDGGTVVELSVATDDASVAAMQGDPADPLPPEAVALLRGGSLRLSLPLAPEAKDSALAFRLQDSDLVEFRMIGAVLYARADVPALLAATGQDPAIADSARQMLTQMQVLPGDAVDGRWIKFTGIEEAVKAFSEGTPQASPSPAFDQSRLREAAGRVASALTQAATVSRVGKDADGDHLRATVPLREAYRIVETETEGLLPFAPEPGTSIEDVPDTDVVFDVWLRGGRVALVEFDFLQLREVDPEAAVPDGVTRLALRATFTPFDGAIQEPADATPVDVSGLLRLVMAGMAGAFGTSMSGLNPMPPGLDPSMLPPGFDPSLLPPGFDPSLLPPGSDMNGMPPYPGPPPAPNG